MSVGRLEGEGPKRGGGAGARASRQASRQAGRRGETKAREKRRTAPEAGTDGQADLERRRERGPDDLAGGGHQGRLGRSVGRWGAEGGARRPRRKASPVWLRGWREGRSESERGGGG